MFKFQNYFKNNILFPHNNFFKASKFGYRNLIKERLGLSMKLKEAVSSTNLGLLLFGISIGGFSYLGYESHKREAEYQKSLSYLPFARQDKVTERLKSTLLYFAGGITTTSALVAYMMRKPGILTMSTSFASLLITIPGLLICGYGLRSTQNDSPRNNIVKHIYWLGLNGFMAFSIAPIIAFTAEMKLVADAFLLTSCAFGGLGLTAYMSHDQAFLGMSGFLGAGFGALFAISIANMFFQSHALFNLWLYGGLALFLGFTIYDLKNIQVRAQRSYYFDPMSESISVYYDFINIFVRILLIMQNNKGNK